jgi:hypothetical protein
VEGNLVQFQLLAQSMLGMLGMLLAYACCALCCTATRNPVLWPFCSESIWNTPVGSDAIFVDAQIGPFHNLGPDVSHFIETTASDPLVEWYKVEHWGGPRCKVPSSGKSYQHLHVPNTFIVPDITAHSTPNGACVLLQPDRHTLVQMNPVCRNTSGASIYGDATHGEPQHFEDLYGMGQTGAYGGSGLSALGGSIRPGEWASSAFKHALKTELYAHYYYSQAQLPGQLQPGFRWPAVTCDGYAFNCSKPGSKPGKPSPCYNGTVRELQPGALLAVPPTVTVTGLGLVSTPAIKLFHALQDYGAYVVADSAWNSTSIAMEAGVTGDVNRYRYSPSSSSNVRESYYYYIDRLHHVQYIYRLCTPSTHHTISPTIFHSPCVLHSP